MQAIISGRAGVAILQDGDQLLSIGLDRSLPPEPRSPRELRFLLGDARDHVFVEDADLDTIRQRLQDERGGDDALQLTLFLMDPALSSGAREESSAALEALLGRDVVLRFVEGVLYSHPVPGSADLNGALHIAGTAHHARAGQMLKALAEAQTAIDQVGRAWEALPTWLFEGDAHRTRVRVAFVRDGLFCRAAGLRRMSDSLASIAIKLTTLPGMQAIKGCRKIIELWFAPLIDRFARFLTQVRSGDPWELMQIFGGTRADRVILLQYLFFVDLRPVDAPDVILRTLGAAPVLLRRGLLELLDDAGVRIEPPVEGARGRSELGFYLPLELGKGRIAHQPLELPNAIADVAVDYGAFRPMQGWEREYLGLPPAGNTGAYPAGPP